MKKLLMTTAMALSVVTFSFAGEVKKSSDIPENQIKCLEKLMDAIAIGPEPIQRVKNTILGSYLTQGYPPCDVLDIYNRMMKYWDYWEWGRKSKGG